MSSTSSTRSLRRYARPRGSTLEQREGVRRIRVLAEDDDADVRVRRAEALGCADALVGAAGGIRMSVTTTSGRSSSTAASSDSRSPHVADDLELGTRLEQSSETLADEVVVLGEHEADRHARSIRGAGHRVAAWICETFHTNAVDRQRNGGDMRTIGILLAASMISASVLVAAGCGGSSSTSAEKQAAAASGGHQRHRPDREDLAQGRLDPGRRPDDDASGPPTRRSPSAVSRTSARRRSASSSRRRGRSSPETTGSRTRRRTRSGSRRTATRARCTSSATTSTRRRARWSTSSPPTRTCRRSTANG